MRWLATLVVLGALVGPAGARSGPYDGIWSAWISGTIRDTSRGTVLPYGAMNMLFKVKGTTITSDTKLLSGRITLANGRARFSYVYFPRKAPCPFTVQLRRQGTGRGIVQCVLHLPRGSGTWALQGKVQVKIEARTS